MLGVDADRKGKTMNARWILPVLLLAPPLALAADVLQIGDQIVTKNDSLSAVLNLPEAMTGQGTLTLTWTDSYGRKVAVVERPVAISGDKLPISLPLDRAVALQNFLQAKLVTASKTVESQKAEFIVTPDNPKWDDYAVIMYFAYRRPEQQKALWDIGFNAGKISSNSALEPTGGRVWYRYGFPFYCDQISTFFYAAYHTPAYNPKQKMLLEAKKAYEQDRTSKEPFFRKPCLEDPDALAKATDRMAKAVKAQMRFRPFFYGHTDEGGVADLPSAWDFCFCPNCLKIMRTWLKGQYGSLDALNKEWETSFATWDEVTPFTTDEMMARKGDNLSPWADHRFFMNQSFADALLAGTKAAESVDPSARCGMLGCQMPAAFGGYNYWLLSQVMTAIEPYNIGNCREIWRSFAPDKPACTTGFGAGDNDIWRLWYQLLHGDVGVIIYDEKHSYLDENAKPTEMAAKIAPTYKELTAGICRQIQHMQPANDPIAIHYSQPSITAYWMFEARPEGKDWLKRGSAAERLRSDFLRLRESFTKLIEDNLRTYTFVAYAQLEDGAFDRMDTRILFLPESIAMSQKECDAVRRFVERGGTAVADCRTALMDQHCKMLQKGQLDDLFGVERTSLDYAPGASDLRRTKQKDLIGNAPASLEGVHAAEPGITLAKGAVAMYADAKGTPAVIVNRQGRGRTIYLNAVVTDYHRWRLVPPQGESLRQLVNEILDKAKVDEQFDIEAAGGQPPRGIEIFPFRSGDLTLLGINRNYQLRVNELGPPEYQKQDALEAPLKLTVDLEGTHAVYNQRTGQFLGKQRKVMVDVPKYEPVILAMLPEPAKGLTITADRQASRGDLVTATLKLDGRRIGNVHAFHVKVLGPDGKEIRPLQENILAPKGQATWKVPFAVTDPPGEYTLQVRDVATGISAQHKLAVK
jgi:hypothetical protein